MCSEVLHTLVDESGVGSGGDTAPGRILIAASPRRRRNKWIQGRLIISGRGEGVEGDQERKGREKGGSRRWIKMFDWQICNL